MIVDQLMSQLEAEKRTPADLGQAVCNAAFERAVAINNEGLRAQVEFLLKGSDYAWKPYDILNAARLARL